MSKQETDQWQSHSRRITGLTRVLASIGRAGVHTVIGGWSRVRALIRGGWARVRARAGRVCFGISVGGLNRVHASIGGLRRYGVGVGSWIRVRVGINIGGRTRVGTGDGYNICTRYYGVRVFVY